MAFGMDPMTALSVAGQATERLEFGTAIVPTMPRHPVVMAQGARTAQAALGGRFTLGVGVSHPVMMRDGLGLPYERPVEHLREYLSVMAPLLRGEPVSFRGRRYEVEVSIAIDCDPVPVLIAALGSAALRVAGELTDGTITAWAGPRTLETYIVPHDQRRSRRSRTTGAAGRRDPADRADQRCRACPRLHHVDVGVVRDAAGVHGHVRP